MAESKGTGLRLVRARPVQSLLKWQLPPEMEAHCHELLGIDKDTSMPKFQNAEPEGRDARSSDRTAE